MSDSGLQFFSMGSVESMYVGSTYEIKVGSVNEIMVGSEAKINAAVSNTLSLEAELAMKCGRSVEWSNIGGYKIEHGEVFELKDESSQFATNELKFQAARTLPAQGAGVPLDAIKSTIKKALLAVAAVNVAIATAEDPKRARLSPRRNERWLKVLYFTPALFWIYFRAAAKETATYGPALRRRSPTTDPQPASEKNSGSVPSRSAS